MVYLSSSLCGCLPQRIIPNRRHDVSSYLSFRRRGGDQVQDPPGWASRCNVVAVRRCCWWWVHLVAVGGDFAVKPWGWAQIRIIWRILMVDDGHFFLQILRCVGGILQIASFNMLDFRVKRSPPKSRLLGLSKEALGMQFTQPQVLTYGNLT